MIEKLYSLVKDVELETTETSRSAMIENFANEEWAIRPPKVILGVNLSGDNYWKGKKTTSGQRRSFRITSRTKPMP